MEKLRKLVTASTGWLATVLSLPTIVCMVACLIVVDDGCYKGLGISFYLTGSGIMELALGVAVDLEILGDVEILGDGLLATFDAETIVVESVLSPSVLVCNWLVLLGGIRFLSLKVAAVMAVLLAMEVLNALMNAWQNLGVPLVDMVVI